MFFMNYKLLLIVIILYYNIGLFIENKLYNFAIIINKCYIFYNLRII